MAFHEYKTLKNHLRKIHGVTESKSFDKVGVVLLDVLV